MRGYYRVPKLLPANRVSQELANIVVEKFGAGWPKARIAREFRLNRRTVSRICDEGKMSTPKPVDCAESTSLKFGSIARRKHRFLHWWKIPPAQN